MYLKRKPYNPSLENKYENRRKFVMRNFARVLVKVVLFQFRRHGHPQDGATHNFFSDSKISKMGNSNEVSFVIGYISGLSIEVTYILVAQTAAKLSNFKFGKKLRTSKLVY